MKQTPWLFGLKEMNTLEDCLSAFEGAEYFIYKLTFRMQGKEYGYIGYKSLYSKRKKRFGKKKLAAMTDKRLKKYEMIIKESDWCKYHGSNKYIKELIATNEDIIIHREILQFCKSNVHYWEAKYLFSHGVLEQDNDYWINGNILGRFYKHKKE